MSETPKSFSTETTQMYHAPEIITEQMLLIENIRMDGNTQTRVGIDPQVVSDYADEMKREGASPFPPIDVFEDSEGIYWPADGLHRLAAFQRNGQTEIRARVYRGSRLDALIHSANSNQQHGLRRTNADKRHCVEMILSEPKFKK